MYVASNQVVLTELVETTAELCIDLFHSISPPDEYPAKAYIRGAALVVAQILVSDAATEYCSQNPEKVLAKASEIRRKICQTTQKLLDDARSLALSKKIGDFSRLIDVSWFDISRILSHASGRSPRDSTPLISAFLVGLKDIDVPIQRILTDEALLLNQNYPLFEHYPTSPPGIATRKSRRKGSKE